MVTAEDFTHKTASGQVMNGKQAEAMLKEEFASTKSVKEMVMTPGDITVKGNEATTISNGKFTGVIVDAKGELGKKGATHTLSESGTSRITLAKKNGAWKVKSVEGLKETMTLDGKPFDPAAAAKQGGKKK